MLEGLINNNLEVPVEQFNLNSQQLYLMAKREDVNLNKFISNYKAAYKLELIDVYVNMALIHGQN